MSGIARGQAAAAIQFDLTPIAWELWQLDELEAAARLAGAAPNSVPVHLEIDTGMSRQGVLPGELSAVFSRFAPGSPLRLEAVMTHLYAADEAGGETTREQLASLDGALARISSAGLFAEWLNVGASAALLAGQAEPIAELAGRHGMKALIRPGLALYGVVPAFDPPFDSEPPSLAAARSALEPVLAWKSSVIGVRSIPAGATIGYNGTFISTEPMRLALVAVGYADGLSRSLGNRFELLVRGERAPLVGRVSMDQSVLDVTEIPGVSAGDEVVLIGKQGSETIAAQDHARATGTIPWEIFTRIAPRVARTAVD
jgi:alanine racemase